MKELGMHALAVPEGAGGVGAKTVGVVAVVEQLGEHAFPSPLCVTLASSYVLRAAGTEAASRWLGRVAEGTAISLATTDKDGSLDPSRTDVTATRSGANLVLEGTASFVQDASKVDAFLVSARDGASVVLVAVSKTAPGVTVMADRIVDLTRDQAHVRFERVSVPAEDVVATEGIDTLTRATPFLLTLIAADLVGIAEWQLKTTCEYAKTRQQFERPIGAFQAVKHPLVDMMLGIDQARSLVYAAAAACDAESSRAMTLARMAKSKASDVGAFASGRSVQLHGGIGFTWECDVHIFFKRSMHGQALFGDGAYQRKMLADILVGPISR